MISVLVLSASEESIAGFDAQLCSSTCLASFELPCNASIFSLRSRKLCTSGRNLPMADPDAFSILRD